MRQRSRPGGALGMAAVVLVIGSAIGSVLGSVMAARAQSPPPNVPFTIALDAAHGGAETGTTLTPQLLEKDVVLALSIRLRSALAARGMHVVTTRESDGTVALDTRAAEANHARAAACLVLHATASGSGVHLYTSSLGNSSSGQAQPAAGTMPDVVAGPVPWATAGAPFGTDSLQLASELSSALASAGIPFTLGRVRLAPLDALRCPAVAVEVAPLRRSGSGPKSTTPAPIDDSAYQGRLIDALAAALVEWRSEHERAVSGPAGVAR